MHGNRNVGAPSARPTDVGGPSFLRFQSAAFAPHLPERLGQSSTWSGKIKIRDGNRCLGRSIVLGGLSGGQGAQSLSETHNKLILHPSFRQTLAALKEIRVALPRDPVTEDTSLRNYDLPRDRTRLAPLEAERKFALDGKRGEEVAEKGVIVSAYDESINKFTALEGTAYFTSHSLVVLASERYLPINLLTFYFLTRSRDIQSRSEFIQYSEDFTMDSEKTHILDKITF